jgi:(R)-2-hydroxyglutarate---pyruvate transhydrogenase
LGGLLEAENPLINTGVLSQSPAQFSSLWALREGVTEAVSKEGKAYKYDISVPLSTFKTVVDGTREHLRSKGLLGDKAVKHVLGYGHVGDGKLLVVDEPRLAHAVSGNLHLNVVANSYTPEIQDALEPYIYEIVGRYFEMIHLYLTQHYNSITQRVHISRAWNRVYEDPRAPLLEE